MTDDKTKAALKAKEAAKQKLKDDQAARAKELDTPVPEVGSEIEAEVSEGFDAILAKFAEMDARIGEQAQSIGALQATVVRLEFQLETFGKLAESAARSGGVKTKDDGTHAGSIDDLGTI